MKWFHDKPQRKRKRPTKAERERNARVILGSAEIELSEKYAQASQKYKGNEEALMLRSLNLLLEAVRSKGSMILVPSDVPHLMNKAVAAALARKTGAVQSHDDMAGGAECEAGAE